jgi:hypothetical protein
VLGTYNPLPQQPQDGEGRAFKAVELDVSRAKYWLGVGAQPSDSAWRLLEMVRFRPFPFVVVCWGWRVAGDVVGTSGMDDKNVEEGEEWNKCARMRMGVGIGARAMVNDGLQAGLIEPKFAKTQKRILAARADAKLLEAAASKTPDEASGGDALKTEQL